MICEPCESEGHTTTDCENVDLPMIQRSCTCRCDRPEPDPAPYWSAINQEHSWPS